MMYQENLPTTNDIELEPTLRMISMRIQTEVVKKLKKIATQKGIGYQPYIRMLLTEHINTISNESEKSSS